MRLLSIEHDVQAMSNSNLEPRGVDDRRLNAFYTEDKAYGTRERDFVNSRYMKTLLRYCVQLRRRELEVKVRSWQPFGDHLK